MPQSRFESGDHLDGAVENSHPELPQWLADLNRSLEALKPHQRTFLARAVRAVMELTQLDENSLVRAAESSREIDVLVRVLQSPDALKLVEEFEPLADPASPARCLMWPAVLGNTGRPDS